MAEKISGEISLHPKQAEVFLDRHRFKVVTAGRRWGKCCAEGTQVSMASGELKNVQDVRQGDLVLTINEETYALESMPVKAMLNNGVRETLEIVTKSGKRLCVTPNHPLLSNNIWTEAKDLQIGDLVAIQRSSVFGSVSMKRHEVDMLAIWLAEGSRYTITNTTKEIIDVIYDISKSFGEGLFVKRSRDGISWSVINRDKSGGPQSGSNNPMRRCLELYNLWGKNSKDKFIPQVIFNLPKHQLARFLNLFIACDGSINVRSKNTWAMEIGLANETMIRQLAELFLKFGIRGNISKKIHNKKSSVTGENFISWRFIVSDRDSLIRYCEQIGALGKEHLIERALNAANKSSGSRNSYLPISHDEFVKHLSYKPNDYDRKGGFNFKVASDLPDELRALLTSWRKQTSSRISEIRYERIREFSDGYYDAFADGDLAWDEITSVTRSKEVNTYDLSVEGNHNFIANGIITHNTTLSKASIIHFAAIPDRYIWYIAPSYRMSKQIMWSEMMEAVPRHWIRRTNETVMRIELINNTVIELKGADKPDGLRGVGLDYIVLDEFQDMKPEVWKTVLRPTLATTGGHALFIGTPKSYNHLYELHCLGQPGSKKSKQWKSWQFPTITSPFVPKEEIENARRDMDDKSFAQEFMASFTNMSGRVYHSFDRNLNVSDKVVFNPKLPIYIGQDFNIDPMSSCICQIQPNGEVWVVDEVSLLGSNTFETCDELEKRYWRFMNHIIVYPDPAGGSKQHARGETDLDIFREKGFKKIKYRRKHPAVADRINSVNKMIRAANGDIKLKINPKCRNLITSLEQSTYKEGGRDVDKSQGIEHMADALGYFLEIEFPVRKIEIAGISI